MPECNGRNHSSKIHKTREDYIWCNTCIDWHDTEDLHNHECKYCDRCGITREIYWDLIGSGGHVIPVCDHIKKN